MERARVLLANEPPAYREVLALVLQEMRVPADVSCVEPEQTPSRDWERIWAYLGVRKIPS